jgi:hypothetical protein
MRVLEDKQDQRNNKDKDEENNPWSTRYGVLPRKRFSLGQYLNYVRPTVYLFTVFDLGPSSFFLRRPLG